MMNKLGMGIVVSARDLASKTLARLGNNFSSLTKRMTSTAQRQATAMRRIAIGGSITMGARGAARGIHSMMEEAGQYGLKVAEVSTLVDEKLFPRAAMDAMAKDLARFGQDATLQAAALYDTVSAGYNTTAKAQEVMTAANKLAVGGVTDVRTAVNGLTGALNNYQSAGMTSADVSDAMFVAVRAGKTTVAELSESMGRAAPMAAQLGVSFQEFMAAVATATTKNIQTSEVMSGLKAAFQNVLKPTDDAAAAAAKFGFKFNLAALKSQGFAKFLDTVMTKTKGDQQALTDLFGSVEAANTVFALGAERGAKFKDVLDQMTGAAGATEAAFAKVNEEYAQQVKIRDALVGNIRKTLGAGMERLLAPGLRLLNRGLEAFDRFLRSLPPEAVEAIAGVATAIVGIGGAVGGIMLATGALGMMGISLSSLLVAAIPLLVAIPAITVLFGGLAVAAYAAYRVFAKNTGGIATSWQDALRKIQLAWRGMVAIVRGQEFSKELTADLDKAENAGVMGFLRRFEGFMERMRAFWAGLKRGFEEGVNALADSPSMKRLTEALRGVFAMFTGEDSQNSQEALKSFGKSGESTGKRLAALGEIALDAAFKFIDLSKQFMAFVSSISAKDVTEGVNNTITTFNGLWESLKGLAEVVKGIVWGFRLLVNLLQAIGAFAGEAAGGIAVRIENWGLLDDAMRAESEGQLERAARLRALVAARENVPVNEQLQESRKRVGDVVRMFDETSIMGKPAEEREALMKKMEPLRAPAAAAEEKIAALRARGMDTTAMEETLRDINSNIKQLVKAPPPTVKVTVRDDRAADRDRDMEPLYLPGGA
jgi:TP901 family phage tail tape measure protein